MTLEVGTTIGRYRILGLVGRGGMADVYRAHQASLDRIVALKVIRAGAIDDPAFAERFAREARAVAKLEHPNIVSVFDFEEIDGRSLLVMQYLDAGTLKERLADQLGPMPRTEIARIVHGIAAALDHAHAQGIVHRDIKPSNVMLTAGGRVMVTDFGIAKVLGTATTQYTQTAVSIGTPDYMSPEQGQGLAVDRRSDIYALGAVAYEMLTGRIPFPGDTPVAVMLKHIRDPLPRASAADPTVSPATDAVLAKAMAKTPDERHASAGEFAAALEGSFSDAAPTTVVTDPTIAVNARPRRRRIRLAVLVASLGAIVIAGGGIALAAGVFSLPAARLSPQASATTSPLLQATSPTSTPLITGDIPSCNPAVVTASNPPVIACVFTGLPPGEPVTITLANQYRAPATIPGVHVVGSDGTYAFNIKPQAGDAPATTIVYAAAGAVTKALQFRTQ